MPGFQIRFVLVAGAVWREGDVALEAGGDAGGEDVPEVLGDDVGGDEIHQALGRALAAIVGDVAAAASADDAHGGLDLHPQHAAVMFDHEVVRGGAAPARVWKPRKWWEGGFGGLEIRPASAEPSQSSTRILFVSPLRGFSVVASPPTAGAVGCILAPLRG